MLPKMGKWTRNGTRGSHGIKMCQPCYVYKMFNNINNSVNIGKETRTKWKKRSPDKVSCTMICS